MFGNWDKWTRAFSRSGGKVDLLLFPSRSSVATSPALFWSNNNLFHFNLVLSSCSKICKWCEIAKQQYSRQSSTTVKRGNASNEIGKLVKRPRDDRGAESLRVKDEELALKTCFRMRFLWWLLTLFGYVWVGNALRTAFPVVLSEA